MASNLKTTTVDGDLTVTNGNVCAKIFSDGERGKFEIGNPTTGERGSLTISSLNNSYGTECYLNFSNIKTLNQIPAADNTYNMGSADNRWNRVYTSSLESKADFTLYIAHNHKSDVCACYGGGNFIVGTWQADPNFKFKVVGNAKIDSSLDVGGDLRLDGANITIKRDFHYNTANYARNLIEWYQDGSMGTKMGGIGFSGNSGNTYNYLYITPKGATYDSVNAFRFYSDKFYTPKIEFQNGCHITGQYDSNALMSIVGRGNELMVSAGSNNALHINYRTSSEGYAPTSWVFHKGASNNYADISAGSISPGTNNTYDLGTSSLKWKNVYATTFNGNLTGLATSATTADDATLFNGKDFYYYMSLAKYRYFDLAKFGNLGSPTVEISTDGTNFVESVSTALTQSLFIGEGSEYTITDSTTKAVRWTWKTNIASRFPECFVVQWATSNAVVNVKVETSQDSGTSWYDGTVTSSMTTSFGASYVKFSTRSTADKWIRLTLSSSATTKASNIHLLARRNLRNEAVEYPYRADALKNIYPWTTDAQSLGTSNYKWKNGYFAGTIYATTFSGTSEYVKISTGTGNSDRPILVTNENNNNSLYYPSTVANRATLNYATGLMKAKTINVKGSANSTATIESDNGTNIFIKSNGVIPFVVDGNVVRRSGSATGATLGASAYPWYGVYGVTGNFTENVSIGGNLTITGSVTGTAFYEGSDIAYKTDIKPLVNRGSLKPVEYTLKKTGERQLGFIAQDVQELYPELVGKNEEDKLVLNYPNLTAVLAAQNNELKKEVELLKKEIEEIKAMLKK